MVVVFYTDHNNFKSSNGEMVIFEHNRLTIEEQHNPHQNFYKPCD